MAIRLCSLALSAAAVCWAQDCADGRPCQPSGEEEDVTLLQLNSPAKAGGRHASFRAEGGDCPAEADWIVVGGGAGGCSAAAALADKGEQVLLLERGPSDLEIPSTQSAAGWPKSVNDGGEQFRFKEGTWGIVAKVLGGGTALNGGLIFNMPESWFQEHMPGVDYAKVTASATKINQELGAPSMPTDFGLAWNQGLQEAGYGVADLNDPKLTVINNKPFLPYTAFHFAEQGEPRLGAAHLLHTRSNLANLRVVTEANVLKVLFSGTTAVGVKLNLTKTGQVCNQVTAKKGVILAAGAIRTPQLLQISGVGPEEVLKKIGVEPVLESEKVGRNFVDRLVACVAAMSPQTIKFTIGYTVMADVERKQVIEGVGGGSIGTELAVASMALLPPAYRHEALRATMQTMFNILPQWVLDMINKMAQSVNLQMDTRSRGYVTAVSADSTVSPEVSANYFAEKYDLDSQVARLQELVRILELPSLEPWTMTKIDKTIASGIAEILKVLWRYGEENDTGHKDPLHAGIPLLDSAFSCVLRETHQENSTIVTIPCMPDTGNILAMERYARDNVISSYHYFGSAAGSVDPKTFAVTGTSNLFIADASVIPVPTMTNPQGTIMALGHYIGDMLR